MWREKTKPKRRQQRYSLLLDVFASPAAVTLHTINIHSSQFTVFLVSVCVTVNKEH